MKKIFKYLVSAQVKDIAVVSMPENAGIVKIAIQHGSLYVWAIVPPNPGEMKDRHIVAVGTGHEYDHGGRYLDTFFFDNGNLVVHYFEVIP